MRKNRKKCKFCIKDPITFGDLSPPKALKKAPQSFEGMQVEYYKRLDVRRAILDFARAGNGRAVRECAFFNRLARRVQRHLSLEDAKRGWPVIFDSEAELEQALRAGASAFYCSYWRYAEPREPLHPLGHDLVWTIRASSGGLRFAKAVTVAVLEALADGGFSEPWVKYSGELGFDLVIPLEAVPADSWAGDIEALADLQGALTRYIAGYLVERVQGFSTDAANSHVTIRSGSGTCSLSELRLRRGLLLAPMSLCPSSGLVSVPLAPEEVAEFSVLDASPADASACRWEVPKDVAEGLIREVQEWRRAVGPAEVKITAF